MRSTSIALGLSNAVLELAVTAVLCGACSRAERDYSPPEAADGNVNNDAASDPRDAASDPRDAVADGAHLGDGSNETGDTQPRDGALALDASPNDGSTDAEASSCGSPTDVKNCGWCGHDCTALPNLKADAAVECRSGICHVPPGACATGWAHCSAVPDDGCEVDVTKPDACSSYQTCTGTACSPNYVATVSLGWSNYDRMASVAIAADGSYYITGTFQGNGVDFDPRPTSSDYQSSGGATTSGQYVTKFAGDGTYQWTKVFSKVAGDALKTATGPDGSVFVVGQFSGSAGEVDLNPSSTATDYHTTQGYMDAFVVRLAGDGTFIWSAVLPTEYNGGLPSTQINDILIATDGSVYLAGAFAGPADLDPGPQTDIKTSDPTNGANTLDAFIMKLNSDGARSWVSVFTGAGSDYANAIALAADGSIWSGGGFGGGNTTVTTDFGARFTKSTTTSTGDAFLVKSSSYGETQAVYAIGSPEWFDSVRTLAIDGSGSLYVGGEFAATVDFDLGSGVVNRTADPKSTTTSNSFLLKLDSSIAYQWVYTYPAIDLLRVRIAPDGGPVVAGRAQGTCDFGPPGSPDTRVSQGDQGYILHLDSSGRYLWTVSIPGNSVQVQDIAVNSTGFIAAGTYSFNMVDFDPGPAGDNFTPANNDGFVTRYRW